MNQVQYVPDGLRCLCWISGASENYVKADGCDKGATDDLPEPQQLVVIEKDTEPPLIFILNTLSSAEGH